MPVKKQRLEDSSENANKEETNEVNVEAIDSPEESSIDDDELLSTNERFNIDTSTITKSSVILKSNERKIKFLEDCSEVVKEISDIDDQKGQTKVESPSSHSELNKVELDKSGNEEPTSILNISDNTTMSDAIQIDTSSSSFDDSGISSRSSTDSGGIFAKNVDEKKINTNSLDIIEPDSDHTDSLKPKPVVKNLVCSDASKPNLGNDSVKHKLEFKSPSNSSTDGPDSGTDRVKSKLVFQNPSKGKSFSSRTLSKKGTLQPACNTNNTFDSSHKMSVPVSPSQTARSGDKKDPMERQALANSVNMKVSLDPIKKKPKFEQRTIADYGSSVPKKLETSAHNKNTSTKGSSYMKSNQFGTKDLVRPQSGTRLKDVASIVVKHLSKFHQEKRIGNKVGTLFS